MTDFGRIELPKGKTANERAKDNATHDVSRLFSTLTSTDALTLLLDAEAHLIAEYGYRQQVKEGPIKQASQDLAFARRTVLQEVIRERVQFFTGKGIEQLQSELVEAISVTAKENYERPDVELTKNEERKLNAERMCIAD